ncbi:hypothetical protein WISP_75888 [Willisornis vidua]|uniref:ATP synthase F0 subunit 8 n=1 Tax=Willisornis vidua TaxID=1566151 RepID=A0ABQ9D902_9PASS|nr:hypothetical protein WISP_75888 [Willisornis vidua]
MKILQGPPSIKRDIENKLHSIHISQFLPMAKYMKDLTPWPFLYICALIAVDFGSVLYCWFISKTLAQSCAAHCIAEVPAAKKQHEEKLIEKQVQQKLVNRLQLFTISSQTKLTWCRLEEQKSTFELKKTIFRNSSGKHWNQ